MIDVDDFMSMPLGLDFARKCARDWKGQADETFVDFVVEHHATMGECRLRHALSLIYDRDLPRLRDIMKQYIGHQDPGFKVAAGAFFEKQLECGYIDELPEGICT